MKKSLFAILLITFIFILSACANNDKEPQKEWDCTVDYAGKSGENSYTITYSQEKIVSRSGLLIVENKSNFDVTVHFMENDNGEETSLSMKAGDDSFLDNVNKDVVYTVGVHADVDEGTEIKLKVYDGEKSDVY